MRVRACVVLLAVAACGPLPGDQDAGEGGGAAGGTSGGAAGGVAGGVAGGGTAGGSAGGLAGGSAGGGLAGGSGGGATDGGLDAGQLVSVSHPRELRGLWVSTVFNLDFPLASARQADAGTNELRNIVDTAANHGFNAIVFQVRPESDTFYASAREPWSRFAGGTQGVSPGWDPLQTLVALAHAKGLEVHAWLNPFRGLTATTVVAAPSHITQQLPQHAVTYTGSNGTAGVTMDPSAEPVRAWVAAVVGDLAAGYDIDGIHYDDYLYPYPGATPFPDEPQFQAYVADAGQLADGGTPLKNDWRRANINALMRLTAQTLNATKPYVRFGVSPFGIYRPGTPAGITGLDAYNAIACDPLEWLSQGWVDYVAPQLYWTTGMTGQKYGLLIDWWAQQAALSGRYVFAGHALYKLNTTSEWSVAELKEQVRLTRAQAPSAAGSIWFRYAMLRDNLGGMKAVFRDELYANPALPPPVAALKNTVVPAPTVTVAGNQLTLGHSAPATLRGYTVYRSTGAAFSLDRFVPGASATVTLGAGTWAVAAVNRADVESQGVVTVLP